MGVHVVPGRRRAHRVHGRNDELGVERERGPVLLDSPAVSRPAGIAIVRLDPGVSLSREVEAGGVARGPVGDGQRVDRERLAVGDLDRLVGIRGAVEKDAGVEAAVGRVPHAVSQERRAVPHVREALVAERRAREGHRRRGPRHAGLVDDEATPVPLTRPVGGEVGVEAAALAVHGGRVARGEDVPDEIGVELVGEGRAAGRSREGALPGRARDREAQEEIQARQASHRRSPLLKPSGPAHGSPSG